MKNKFLNKKVFNLECISRATVKKINQFQILKGKVLMISQPLSERKKFNEIKCFKILSNVVIKII